MRSKTVNTALIVAGVLAIAGMAYMSWNSETGKVSSAPHAQTEEIHEHEDEPASAEDLDAMVDQALEVMAQAQETGDMSAFMGQGIQQLLAVVKQDPDHEKAIYHLGLFSIESGQLEKAEKRFEKLILLQPENQEYRKKLDEIREELAK